MNNFPARPYLSPTIQGFLRQLFYRISEVLRMNTDPAGELRHAALDVLDVLVDWLPVNAGNGVLRIETKGTGSLSIIVQDETITISFIAKLPFGLPMEPITVFKLDSEDATLGDDERVRFALLLLRRATWGCWKSNPNVDVDAKWTWTTNLRPSAKWVALREEARVARCTPPTAQHWLSDHAQNPTGA